MAEFSKINIDENTVGYVRDRHYASCYTAADVAAKTVSLEGFELTPGAKVTVKFDLSNTASAPTLNVNNTGAKPIKLDGNTIAGATPATSWSAGQIVDLAYDGTNWKTVGNFREIKASEVVEDRTLETVNFTPNSTYLNNNTVRCRKRGNIVMMQISLNLKALEASASTYTIGSIPSQYAPPFSINTVLTKINANNQILLFQIDNDGTIKVSNSGTASTAGWFDGSIMWMI